MESNRRDGDRRKFDCTQSIAPYRDGKMPSQAEFRRVLCHDLSVNGFSYMSADVPNCELLVVALGTAPYIFVTAAVVHYVPVERSEGVEYLIGCRFVSRIRGPQNVALGSEEMGTPSDAEASAAAAPVDGPVR